MVRHGAADDRITIVWVPGANEIPMVAERLAARGACGMPRLVTGSRANLKITWPEDFGLAAAILAAQRGMNTT